MSNVIVYALAGAVSVIQPAPGYDISALLTELVPAGAQGFIVDAAALPAGPQESWELSPTGALSISAAALAALEAATVPQIISDRQFFQQLALTPNAAGTAMIVSETEALAAVCTGSVPSALQVIIAGLPASLQFAARMKIAGATQFELSDPVALAVAAAYGWTGAQLQAFWSAASKL